MSSAQGQPFDLDEDLFDFAGVAQDPGVDAPEEDLEEIFASFRDAGAQEDLLAVPSVPSADGAQAPAPSARPAAPQATAPAPAPVQPSPSAAPVAASATRSEPPHAVLVPRAPFPRAMVAIALAVTVLNSALAVVMLRGHAASEPRTDGTSSSAHDGTETPAHVEGAHAAPPQEPSTFLPDPEGVNTTHAHPTLDEARLQISRGEYSAARQKVYGLLAIIDRLDDPRRSALEADCQFLIAQSLHLEALARMGASQ